MRIAVLCIGLLMATVTGASAQGRDSVFADYPAYAAFVDNHIMRRSFTDLILQLGGRDEYTKEQLDANQRQMRGVWPQDFESVTVFNRQDLGGGVSQEGRMYWNGAAYAFFYAILHQREGELVVVNFALNSNIVPIMERF